MSELTPTGRTRRSLTPVLLAVIAAFALGAAAVAYIAWRGMFGMSLERSERSAPTAQPTPLATPQPAPSATETARIEAVARVAEAQGGMDQRLAAAEQRIARLDLQTQAASGNAARAEGLLIAFAARRALDRGAPLGYLADQLRLRFGDAQPNSVQTVIDFAQQPITLDVLLARLDGLAPTLASTAGRPALSRLRDELSNLFVIRRETAPSPQPQRRFERARLFLESGRIDRAIAEIEMLPGSTGASAWIADARRYERAQRALDLLETAAVQEPRRLRDGAGVPVEQLSPAAGSAL
jgi:hypothetical protein